jgi:hypothetical protein
VRRRFSALRTHVVEPLTTQYPGITVDECHRSLEF